MKLREELSGDKLRGGFYSPDALVAVCLERIAELTAGRQGLHLLEPSVGDGAFVRGLRHHDLVHRLERITAIELLASEAEKCSAELHSQGFDGSVHAGSFLDWASRSDELFDCAVGNPPFLRYQFVSPEDKNPISLLGQQINVSFAGVSNLWIPIFLGALARLRIGGAFAFIIPAECFTGVSANKVRKWLAINSDFLRVDLFPVGTFPDVLQEVVILSGVRRQQRTSGGLLKVRQHYLRKPSEGWEHFMDLNVPTWTRYLLSPAQLDALNEARELAVVHQLGELARLEVSIVTGANDYFSVDGTVLASYNLEQWAIPLLPRIRHATGIVYTDEDHSKVRSSEVKAHLLHFAPDLPDPRRYKRPAAYLDKGKDLDIHTRYKCRIRDPWYRVPHVWQGRLMLSKRSHRYPRLVLNDAGAFTTDTIYRGRMHLAYQGRETDLVASFHNSLTLLSAEIEGRSFGGGVLELVPSEINRLLVPLPDKFGDELARLDQVLRSAGLPNGGEELVSETDLLLVKADCGFSTDLLEELNGARQVLLRRRLDRTSAEAAIKGIDLDPVP